MKEIYLARDRNGDVNGFHTMPRMLDGEEWYPNDNNCNFLCKVELANFGIDVTAFEITHEKPIKIRAEWREVE